MMNTPNVTENELVMVNKSVVRTFDKTDFDTDTVLPFLDGFQCRSNALVSHGLNRILAWLDGAGGRWFGDDRLKAVWANDTCVIEHNGRSWHVSLSGEAGTRSIELARITEDGHAVFLARGTEKRSNGTTWSQLEIGTEADGDATFVGSVDGEVALGGFEEFCDFMDAVKPSVPREILDVTAGTVWLMKVHRFLESRDLVQLEGGLPGRLSRALDYTMQSLGARSGLLSIIDRYAALADGLSGIGAVWGENILQYNDGDARCCTIPTGDGSVALYSEDTAGGFDQRGYLAVFDLNAKGHVASITGYLLDGDEDDDDVFVSAVVDRTATPAFRFDTTTQQVELAEGRAGHYAIRMMFLQFAYDEEYALENGELEPAKSSRITRNTAP